jgi:hypothetical protein
MQAVGDFSSPALSVRQSVAALLLLLLRLLSYCCCSSVTAVQGLCALFFDVQVPCSMLVLRLWCWRYSVARCSHWHLTGSSKSSLTRFEGVVSEG